MESGKRKETGGCRGPQVAEIQNKAHHNQCSKEWESMAARKSREIFHTTRTPLVIFQDARGSAICTWRSKFRTLCRQQSEVTQNYHKTNVRSIGKGKAYTRNMNRRLKLGDGRTCVPKDNLTRGIIRSLHTAWTQASSYILHIMKC